MKWFGNSWGAPICKPEDRADTPVGENCYLCEVAIMPSEIGVIMPYSGEAYAFLELPAHLQCLLNSLGTGEQRVK